AAFPEACVGVGEAAGAHLRYAAIPARCVLDVPKITMMDVMPGMMAGVIGPSVPPCAVVRPCRSRSDCCGDGSRTQCQRDETKRPAERKQLKHTHSSVTPPFPIRIRGGPNAEAVLYLGL